MKRFTAALILGAVMALQAPATFAASETRNVWLSSDTRGWELSDAGDNNVNAAGFTFKSTKYNIIMNTAEFSVYMDENFDNRFALNGDGAHEIDDVIENARLEDKWGNVLANGSIDGRDGTINFDNIWIYLTKNQARTLYVKFDIKDNAPGIALYVDVPNVRDAFKGEKAWIGGSVRISEDGQNFPNNKQRMIHVYAD